MSEIFFQMRNSNFLFTAFLLGFLAMGCKSLQPLEKEPLAREILRSSAKKNGVLEGILLLNAQTGDTLYSKNAERLFTPASTTKLFTLYSGMKVLPAKLPVFKYRFQDDRIVLRPTGDPTQLHPHFKDSTAYYFLKSVPPVELDFSTFEENPWGPGWAWEDYPYYFSPDRSAFPLHGNVLEIHQIDSLLQVQPKGLANSIERSEERRPSRDRFANRFHFTSKPIQDTLTVPFITSDSLTIRLFQEAYGVQMAQKQDSTAADDEAFRTLSGMSSDSLYKYMLSESDNFLAEQIMLMVSSHLTDTLSFRRSRDSVVERHLPFLKGKARWVDGSGLSRYNLQSPSNLVNTLRMLRQDFPESRLRDLLPAYSFKVAGVNQWELDRSKKEEAYVFAKSGYVGNNYNLAGFLYTKKGEVLVFSVMQNHYLQPTAEIRRRVASLLYQAYLEF